MKMKFPNYTYCKLFSQRPSYVSFRSVILFIFVSVTIIILTVITISSISVVITFPTVIIITAFLVLYLRSHLKISRFHNVISTLPICYDRI